MSSNTYRILEEKVGPKKIAKILEGKEKKISQEKISDIIRLFNLARTVHNYLVPNKIGTFKVFCFCGLQTRKLRDLANEFVKKNYTYAEAETRIAQFKQELTKNRAEGQYMIHHNGTFYLLSPETIEPTPTKIKLRLSEPYCPRVIEMIHEGEKLQCDKSEKCLVSPAKDLCKLRIKLYIMLECKKID